MSAPSAITENTAQWLRSCLQGAPTPSRSQQRCAWHNTGGTAGALAVAQFASNHDGLSIVVTPDTASANQWLRSLKFFGSAQERSLLHFPEWETLPYDAFSPHQDIVSARLACLSNLPKTEQGLLVIPLSTLLQRVCPRQFLDGQSLSLRVGQRFDPHEERLRLTGAGYLSVDTVQHRGEFAVRGNLMDIFPMGSELPVRVDLFDDEIDGLRTFDPDSQRTFEQIQHLELLPGKEFSLTPGAISKFREAWHHTFDVDVRRCSVYQDVSAGFAPSGIEYYLPLFFDGLDTLFDYLPASAQFIFAPELSTLAAHLDSALEAINERFDNLAHDVERPLLPALDLWLAQDELFARLGKHGRIEMQPVASSNSFNFAVEQLPDLSVNARSNQPAKRLQQWLDGVNKPLLFVAESAGRLQVLDEFLRRNELHLPELDGFEAFAAQAESAICIGALDEGLDTNAFALVSEFDLFGERPGGKRAAVSGARVTDPDQVIRNLTELRVGAPVVHIEHGVGRYIGLQTLEIDGAASEFLALAYADEAKLYVPVTSLHLIGRYSGSEEALAPLHRLGSDQWSKAKRKAAERAYDAAAELLSIYAQREAKSSYQFKEPEADYQQFVEQFGYEVTPDQQRAIDEVLADMVADKTTDRLICGDVGFGKTEVAMRAAFVAVNSGKQVAVLVPTTLLAQQHGDTFTDRFANWPVQVDVLSRLRSDQEVEAVIERLHAGKVDILIGTHKLLGKSIRFADLGLVIIDEEHRFGVRQKERLKSLRAEVDVITLTATPIPRTLNLAMSGLRELSIIATPPAKRLSINTFVQQKNNQIIREAINRELQRGGQVFFLHNEVSNIDEAARKISEMVPSARVGIGHGQMPKRELAAVMNDFYHRQLNVLVCTTIIENGIDVPNANTIIIERADRFGLAQLHQLRGRVGRSTRQAYAYLLTPHPKAVSADARKRLEAIESSGELGVGFTLATHDLEIRGAGELLGEGQSGQIEAVGFSLYMELLERAVRSIKAGHAPDLDQPLEPANQEVNLHAATLIPDDYLPDVHTRLILYKRIASAQNDEELQDLTAEIVDRFGRAPLALQRLFAVTSMKLRAESLGIAKIDLSETTGRIEFATRTPVDPMAVVNLVQSHQQTYRLDGATVLRVTVDLESFEDRVKFLTQLLADLSFDSEHDAQTA